MTAFFDKLDRAAAKTTCDVLKSLGGGLVSSGAWAVGLGAGGGALKPIAAGSAALLASNFLCDDPWDPNSPSQVPTGGFITAGSCLESEGCNLQVNGREGSVYLGRIKKLISVTATNPYPNGEDAVIVTYVDCDGITQQDKEGASRTPFSTELLDGAQCVGDPEPPVYNPPPYEYTDPVDGCKLTVELEGFAESPGGLVSPAFKISPADESVLREGGGGIIGGCNFQPVIYWNPDGGGSGGGSGGGGPVVGPAPDPGPPGPEGTPPWLDLLNDIIGGTISNIVSDSIQDALEAPYAGTTYRVVSVCEKTPDGSPISKAVEIPIDEQKGLDAALFRLDAIASLLQPLKDFKQPICDEKIELEGDFRTISFESTERSPFGNDRLRKRFRYRSQSGLGLGELVDHWKDFEWDAGPVCVQHSGHTWGTPQVWAASVDEGKRVILHAGREAGVDPNQVGQWSVSGSNNPRFGVSGRMKVITKGGYYWITERLGSDARPLVALS